MILFFQISIMVSFRYPSVLITGSNRGLGLNILKVIINSSSVPKHIFATCRSLKADNAQELRSLAEANSNLHVLEFDMADHSGASGPRLPELVKQVTDVVQESGLSLLINNAGTTAKESFMETSADTMRSVYEINTIAPLMVTKAFQPLLKRAAEMKHPGDQPEAAVVNISSILGSIECANNGRNFAYKVSKCALNMLTKCASKEFAEDGIAVVSVHPGWVKTDMGGKNADLTVDESVAGIIKVVSSLQRSQTGSFFNHDGTIRPW